MKKIPPIILDDQSVEKIAVIGAGVAGLTCARKLQQAGRRVVVFDKSRGLGGRLATRRLSGTHADHGVCYLQPKGAAFGQLIDELVNEQILRIWTQGIHRLSADGVLQPPVKFAPCYAAPTGANAIARYLGQNLEIIKGQAITTISPIGNGWQLSSADGQWNAEQVVVAVPPAQALAITEGASEAIAGMVTDPHSSEQMSRVNFTTSITAIAVFPKSQQAAAAQLTWQGIQGIDHPVLGWIGLDSSKQLEPLQPVLVVQSSAAFAAENFDAPDLEVIGKRLLASAAPFAMGLNTPEILQVHRWGYAFAQNPLPDLFLTAQVQAPLYFCGDWCGGNRVESAFLSGLAVAEKILDI
jgi:renalase